MQPAQFKRNKTDLTITNGFEFGVGFWLAWLGVMAIGVPLIICAVFVVLAAMGHK